MNWLLLLVGVGWSDSSSILASPAISKVRSMIIMCLSPRRCGRSLGKVENLGLGKTSKQ